MKFRNQIAALLVVFISVQNVFAQFVFDKILWQTSKDLKNPNAIIYDKSQDVLFISNANKTVGDRTFDYSKDQFDGFITKLKPGGHFEKVKWLTGLKDPNGIAVYNSVLYVADSDNILSFDAISGNSIKTYSSKVKPTDPIIVEEGTNSNKTIPPPPKFTNFKSIIVTPENKILALDAGNGIIYEVTKDNLKIVVKDSRLEECSRLCIKDKNVYAYGFWKFLLLQPTNKLLDETSKIKDLRPLSIVEFGLNDYAVLNIFGGLYRFTEQSSPILHDNPLFEGNSDIVFIEKYNSFIVINSSQSRATSFKIMKGE